MSELRISVEEQENVLIAEFQGQIDEDANFGPISGKNAQKMIFDLNGVTMINSCGIRDWIEFQKTIPLEVKLIYKRCPQVIVEQLNIVKGFIRENSQVESFYAPYYNEVLDHEIKVLLTPDQVKEGKAPKMRDEDGNELEFDEIEAQYFSFLKNG